MEKKTDVSSLLSREHALTYLNEIIQAQSRLAAANFDLDSFMNLVVEQIHHLTNATGVVVELVENDEMVYRAATGTVKEHIGLRLPIKNSISGLCVKNQEILRSYDTEKDSRVNIEACRKVKARSLIVCPLFHEDKAVGVIKILSAKPNDFNDNDIQTLELMAGLIGSALANQISHNDIQKTLNERTRALHDLKVAEDKLKKIAHYDFLTQFPNRSLLTQRVELVLAQTKRNPKLSALFFLDIDHFKTINDTLGHAIGDELLKAFSLRVKRCIRDSDMLARWGGDEFVVLLDDLPSTDIAIHIAEKIIKKMQEPFQLQHEKVKVGTSIGITFCNNGNITTENLLDQADKALYKAKQAGRNNFKLFE